MTDFILQNVPSAATGSAWSSLTNAVGSLTLANGTNATEFDQTSNVIWLWNNTTTATSGTTNASPLLEVAANYWTGAASAVDTWAIGSSLAAGTNGASTLAITHSGSTGQAAVSVPRLTMGATGGVILTANGNGIPSSSTYGWFATVNRGGLTINTNNNSSGGVQISCQGTLQWSANSTTTTLGGLVGTYGKRTTVAAGQPALFAGIDLTAKSAAVAATLLYTAPNLASPAGEGQYRISWSAVVTTAASTSSVLGGTNGFQIQFTDVDTGTQITPLAVPNALGTGNTVGTQLSGEVIVNAKRNTVVNYLFDYTSVGVTAMQYALHIKLEYLG